MAKKKPVASGDEAALLAAIRATPEEDTPRLAYADWLDEHGNPDRAEFIRVQCRLARAHFSDPEWHDLTWRQDQLLTDARKKAWGELPVKPVKEKTFRRGFVDDISVHASLFLEKADAIFEQVPLWTLRPLKIGPVWAALLASPHLLRVRDLDLHNSALSQVRCRALAASPNLANLHRLNLGTNRTMGANGFRALLASPHLRELRRLDLNNNDLGNDALEALVGCTTLPNLRHLDLSHNGIGPDGVAHLARAGWLSQLERLDLSGNPLGDEGARRLAESSLLAGLRELHLFNTGVGPDGVRALVNSPHAAAVADLSLDWSRDGDLLAEVARSTALPNLRTLRIATGPGVTRDGVGALARSPLASQLRALELPVFAPSALNALLEAKSLAGLTWLRASAGRTEPNGERDHVARWLAAATHLTNLRALAIYGCDLRDEDMPVLAGCAHLSGLASLALRGGHLSAAGVEAMAASPHFTRLRSLTLPYPSTRDDPTRAKLDERFGPGVFHPGY
ncbi:Repeat-companion domain protein OS=Isosphaera pallida (strain ATCC 43644 / DSM 9630 / IS1B) GN=Isop_0537 PE=4 SV=1: LRR_6: LRR_6: LRR_6 [Gemmataceae bacterium]|nr:Repeat-companion domain protein OS=Isosphaera pallida (strain ATCC 43644 / DSM 9630 / IS1B) GN=Isop_0537 PE=4 SV=1: LRR_6: LRR_6: LRR_6 [Gemmataceae bacterium]VTT97259.1 Repeat-companion domain protein OS=Isosphaera pallida (strain ATCC 43644 / DSM 9630 / IS1B) GN=Isop_0537 PE=4 SV=1: LRR_6: LRR_6: LRR_6 [Gemmataceae bacterium]